MKSVDYSLLPYHMREGAKLYIERGIATGAFMNAVMENDLVRAFNAADTQNTLAMSSWAKFLYNEAPPECWGSKAKVKAWKESGGMLGFD